MKPRHTLTPEENIVGAHTTIPCPENPAHHFVVRENQMSGHAFLGCSHWPECRATAEIILIDPAQQPLL